MKLTALIFFLILVLQIHLAQAQSGADLVERSFTGTSKETLPQAVRQDIIGQAYQNVSEDLIKELIGEERYAKNKTNINNKIIKNAARYMPFSKPGELVPEGPGFKMAVSMKVSLKDLKALLQQNGLLNENESTPVVIPVLSFIDRVNSKSFRWWQITDRGSKSFLLNQGRYFENSLRSAFQKNGFYLTKPQDSEAVLDVPLAFQNEKLNVEDTQFFGQYFNAAVLIDGQVQISKNPQLANSFRIEVRMTALQISNSRPIADVSRRYDTEVGVFEAVVDKKMKEVAESSASDLSSQVFEAWQRGSLGTSMVRITLQGKLNLLFLENFKERLRNQVSQVRNIRERLFEAGKYTFEVDTSATSAELAQKLQGLDIDGKKFNQVSESNNEILVQIN